MIIFILTLCGLSFHKSANASAYIAGVLIMLEVLFVDMPLVVAVVRGLML